MCILYIALSDISVPPILYKNTGKHFLTIISHLSTSDKSLVFINVL